MGGTIRWLPLRPHSLIALGKATRFVDGLSVWNQLCCCWCKASVLNRSAKHFSDFGGINTKIDVLFGYNTEFVEEEIVRQLSSYLKDLRETLADDYISDAPLSNA